MSALIRNNKIFDAYIGEWVYLNTTRGRYLKANYDEAMARTSRLINCPTGKVRNPETGRCVKKTGAIGRRINEENIRRAVRVKPCPRDKVRNPETGRCVKKTGAIGRRINQGNAVLRPASKDRPCTSTQIRNPQTGRCVKKTGAIGRRISNIQRESGRGPTIPILSTANRRKYRRAIVPSLLLSTFNMNPNGVKESYIVKRSDDTDVYAIKWSNGKVYALKHFKGVPAEMAFADEEVNLLMLRAGLPVPKPYGVYKLSDIETVSLSEFDEFSFLFGTLDVLLNTVQGSAAIRDICDASIHIISELCKGGFIHGDLHTGNIGFRYATGAESKIYQFKINGVVREVTPIIVDFGWSRPGRCRPRLELYQLIRGILLQQRTFSPSLIKCIIRTYEKTFETLPTDFKRAAIRADFATVHPKWSELFERYRNSRRVYERNFRVL